jgi:hypothetical protein
MLTLLPWRRDAPERMQRALAAMAIYEARGWCKRGELGHTHYELRQAIGFRVPGAAEALTRLEERAEAWLKTWDTIKAANLAARRKKRMDGTTDTQRISAALDTIDEKVRQRDDAPRLAALSILAPFIAQARKAADEIDAHYAAHRKRFEEIRAVLSRPALSEIKGTDKKQMIDGTRRVMHEIVGFYENAEGLRRDAKKTESVDNATLASRVGWVSQRCEWLKSLSVGTLRALPERWRTLEESVARIASWMADDVEVSQQVRVMIPRAEKPAEPQRHARSSTAARGRS